MHPSITRDADSKGPLLFSLEDTPSMFPTKNFRFGLIWSQSSFLLSVHFKWVLGQRRQQCFWIMLTYGFFSAWQSFNLHTWVFRDSDFWKCSWSHLSVLSEGQGHPIQDWPCPLLTEIPPDSLSLFDDVMYWRWWDIQNLCKFRSLDSGVLICNCLHFWESLALSDDLLIHFQLFTQVTNQCKNVPELVSC